MLLISSGAIHPFQPDAIVSQIARVHVRVRVHVHMAALSSVGRCIQQLRFLAPVRQAIDIPVAFMH